MEEKKKQSRREFLKTAGLSGAIMASTTLTASALSKLTPAYQKKPEGQTLTGATKPAGFKLKYAPPFGMFEASAGKDPLDQMKFIAGQGFRAIFDNGLPGRPPAVQEAIAGQAARLGLEIGPFVAYADFSVESFVLRDESVREMLRGKLKTAIETSKRTGVKLALMVPGRYNQRLDWDYQTANVIENLKWCAGICEPEGVVIVLEPLNPKDHPGLFLTKMSQAYQICKAVGSPSVKILDDIYHQQITEGNIITNIDACWEEIASFHLGDTPGRKEPGTGELNFKNIFKHLYQTGYQGVLCLEHGKSKPGREGELAVIEAYRQCDSFV
ncbi:MAG: TIM barrel protein [Candidatus Saccharicenans sp.]|nr:TIM barrel protein [Candidatus Saccharicenans sp.]MDI6848778.1 TIM barrel protein [Candidatus Saccharicenans sp.]